MEKMTFYGEKIKNNKIPNKIGVIVCNLGTPKSYRYRIYKNQKFSIPFLMPKYLLNPLTIKCFNSIYYRLSGHSKSAPTLIIIKFLPDAKHADAKSGTTSPPAASTIMSD